MSPAKIKIEVGTDDKDLLDELPKKKKTAQKTVKSKTVKSKGVTKSVVKKGRPTKKSIADEICYSPR